MSKRFFDTELCEKEWYLNLTLGERCFIRDVLFSRCDCVGIWTPNRRQVEYLVGPGLDYYGIPQKSKGNIEILPDEKWWLVDFCAFQYGELNPKCPPHKKYIARLKECGLYERVLKGYQYPSVRVQEEEEEEEKEEDSYIPPSSNSYIPSEEKKPGGPRIDEHIKTWNGLGLPTYRYTSLNMREKDRADSLRTLSVYSDEEIAGAIRNYSEILKSSEHEAFPIYPTFAGFLATGIEKYADDAKPFERCRKKGGGFANRDDEGREAALKHLAEIRGQNV